MCFYLVQFNKFIKVFGLVIRVVLIQKMVIFLMIELYQNIVVVFMGWYQFLVLDDKLVYLVFGLVILIGKVV